MKLALALVLAFALGLACRRFGVPVPAPPSLEGVALIAAVTLGFVVGGRF